MNRLMRIKTFLLSLVVLVQLYRVLASLVLELHWRRGDVGGWAPRVGMGENGCRESGKIPRVGYLRRGIRI